MPAPVFAMYLRGRNLLHNICNKFMRMFSLPSLHNNSKMFSSYRYPMSRQWEYKATNDVISNGKTSFSRMPSILFKCVLELL